MKRRITFVTGAILFLGVVILYGAKFIDVPHLSFTEAAKINDTQRKVMVSGHVLANREITPNGGTVTFYMTDAEGTESKIFYDGEDSVDPKTLKECAQEGKQISVAGHTCGDRFHISSLYYR